MLYDQVLHIDGRCCVTFRDYTAAFDLMSHKFIDKVPEKTYTFRKTCSLFRNIYQVVAGTVRVSNIDGKKVFSEVFDVV